MTTLQAEIVFPRRIISVKDAIEYKEGFYPVRVKVSTHGGEEPHYRFVNVLYQDETDATDDHCWFEYFDTIHRHMGTYLDELPDQMKKKGECAYDWQRPLAYGPVHGDQQKLKKTCRQYVDFFVRRATE